MHECLCGHALNLAASIKPEFFPQAYVCLLTLRLQKGTASKAEIAAARAKVSAAKAATMQLRFDLEQMEAQKDLDKTLGESNTIAPGGGVTAANSITHFVLKYYLAPSAIIEAQQDHDKTLGMLCESAFRAGGGDSMVHATA